MTSTKMKKFMEFEANSGLLISEIKGTFLKMKKKLSLRASKIN